MRGFLGVLLAALCGCSAIFIEAPPANYKGDTPPHCSTGKGAVALDVLLSSLATAHALYVIKNYDAFDEDEASLSIGLDLLDVLIHTSSAAWGDGAVNRCRSAIAEYDRREVERRNPPRDEESAPPPKQARVYYCTSSPTDSATGACSFTREKCQLNQGRFVARGLDVGPCTESKVAVCFQVTEEDGEDSQTGCAPTMMSCERQRERVIGQRPDVTVSACADAY